MDKEGEPKIDFGGHCLARLAAVRTSIAFIRCCALEEDNLRASCFEATVAAYEDCCLERAPNAQAEPCACSRFVDEKSFLLSARSRAVLLCACSLQSCRRLWFHREIRRIAMHVRDCAPL